MSFTPNPTYVDAKKKEEAQKEDELFIKFVSSVIPPTLTPTMTDKEIRDRLETVWVWWNE